MKLVNWLGSTPPCYSLSLCCNIKHGVRCDPKWRMQHLDHLNSDLIG